MGEKVPLSGSGALTEKYDKAEFRFAKKLVRIPVLV